MNNRNCKPSLRLVDGGPSPWSIKGMFKAATTPAAPAETISQKYARQDAERAAKAAAAAPAPVAAPAPAAGISSYVGNTALQAREKAAGLRDGGEVPGSGRGDKVPALYEPGEFVVSNAMLKKAPGLRDQLHDLRAEALAAQGKSVEEADADASAVRGSLRASVGGSWYDDPPKRPETQNGQVVSGDAAQRAGVATGGGVDSGTTGNQRGLLRTLTDQAFPATSTILRGRGEDAAYEASKGNWSGAAMHGIRGGIEGAGALGLDVARPVLRALEPVGRGITNTAYSVATGDSAPLVAAPTTSNTPPAQPSLRTPTPTYSGPMGPQINPDAPSLRGRPGADVAGAPGVGKFVENGRTLYSNVAGDNAAMLDKRQVGIVPGMSQDLINRTLTNPDGSRWNANDNATMAANLRDGIDPYRGTSRGAPGGATTIGGDGYGILGKEHEAARVAKMAEQRTKDEMRGMSNGQARIAADLAGQASQRGIAAAQNAATLRNQDINSADQAAHQQVLRRGQDMMQETALTNAERSAARDRMKDRREMEKDERDFSLRKEAHDQAVGTKARENTMSEFSVIGADGKPDLGASKQAFDAVRQIFPGIDSADESTRNKFMPDAKEMHGIFQKARTQDKVGWDAMKFWEAKRPALNAMPNAKQGTTEQVGALGGLVTLNASNGDTLLKQADGTTLNLGQLNSRQRELLERAKTQGWGK